MSGDYIDVLVHGVRALFYIGVPVVVVVSLVGTIVGALQAATTIQEPALGYAARLVALVALLYLLFPAFARTCIDLAEFAFR